MILPDNAFPEGFRVEQRQPAPVRSPPSCTGVVAGTLGIVFGLLGIFSIGFIFVPIAALCSFLGLMRGLNGRSATGVGLSSLGGLLTFAGASVSPTVWVMLAGMGLAASVSGQTPAPQRPTIVATAQQVPRAPSYSPPASARGLTAMNAVAQPALPVRGPVPVAAAESLPLAPAPPPADSDRSSDTKRDIHGFAPGDTAQSVITSAIAAGMRCEKTVDYSFIDCRTGSDEFENPNWRQFRFSAIGGTITGVEFRFKTGNGFREVVSRINTQFQTYPYSDGPLNFARWRLHDGGHLEYRQLGESGAMTLFDYRLAERLRASQDKARRATFPQPRF